MAFTPFDKQIQDLNLDDLNSLVEKVAEGYWVEYKSKFPENSKIAKSIASFANTYGGWYFVGMDSNKTNNVATDICGISLSEAPDPISKIRESIKAHIDPTPIFFIKLIDISADKVAVVVHIPEDQETPFIHKDGRIYRRVADSSDPVVETNRYAVDKLYESGKERAKRFEDFCQDNRTFSQSEEHQGWVNIYVSPNPSGIKKMDIISEEAIDRLLKLSSTPLPFLLNGTEVGRGSLPLNSGQFGFGSVILRQRHPSQVAANSLQIEFFMDGKAKFHIPLKYLSFFESGNIERIKTLDVRNIISELMQDNRLIASTTLGFFDIHLLMMVIANMLTFYSEWYGKELKDRKLRSVVKLDNIWRTIPFCDIESWGKYVQKFGLPVQNYDSIRLPPQKWLDEEAPLWPRICPLITLAVGLPIDLFSDILEKPYVPLENDKQSL